MGSTRRDALRAKALGRPKQFGTEIVEWKGEKYEVRAPAIALRQRLLDDAGFTIGELADGRSMKASAFMRFIREGAFYCTYVPGTNERVFEDADRESLDGMPADGLIDALGGAFFKVLGVKGSDLGKGSGPTPSEPSSSP